MNTRLNRGIKYRVEIMPGYEQYRIVGVADNDLEEFIGGICLGVLVKPMVTECCGQTYCFDCISGLAIIKPYLS